MKIGEIAQQTRVSKSIIRYYEGKGVLPRAVRDAAGNRDYGSSDLARIRLITGLRRLGCSFEDIKNTMTMVDEQCLPSSDLLELLARKKSEVRSEIDRLTYIQGELFRLQDLALALAEQEEGNRSAYERMKEAPSSPLSHADTRTCAAGPTRSLQAAKVSDSNLLLTTGNPENQRRPLPRERSVSDSGC
jgi:DNA-binding transcriptional MerR regulator